MTNIAQFFVDNGTILGRLGANHVGSIIVSQIPDIVANATQPDFDLRAGLMQAFKEAAGQVNNRDATYEALSIASELRLEALTGDAAADAQMAELNTFLTNMDQNPDFRDALHGFATNVGVDKLDFSNLSTDPETAARYQTALTHLSEHDFGRAGLTKTIETLAADPDNITAADFTAAIRGGMSDHFATTFGGITDNAALLDALKNTDGLLGDASAQTEFFNNLAADPASQEAFLDAVRSNSTFLTMLSLDSAQDPSTLGAFADVVSQNWDTNQLTQTLGPIVNDLSPELQDKLANIKPDLIRDVFGNPDTNFDALQSYFSSRVDTTTGDLDLVAIGQDILSGDLPPDLENFVGSIAKSIRNNFSLEDLMALVSSENWHDMIAHLHVALEDMNLPDWLQPYAEMALVAFEYMVPAMVDGVAKIGNLFAGIGHELVRATGDDRNARMAAIRANNPAAPANLPHAPGSTSSAFENAMQGRDYRNLEDIQNAIAESNPGTTNTLNEINQDPTLSAQFQRFATMTPDEVNREVQELVEQVANGATPERAASGIGVLGR